MLCFFPLFLKKKTHFIKSILAYKIHLKVNKLSFVNTVCKFKTEKTIKLSHLLSKLKKKGYK